MNTPKLKSEWSTAKQNFVAGADPGYAEFKIAECTVRLNARDWINKVPGADYYVVSITPPARDPDRPWFFQWRERACYDEKLEAKMKMIGKLLCEAANAKNAGSTSYLINIEPGLLPEELFDQMHALCEPARVEIVRQKAIRHGRW